MAKWQNNNRPQLPENLPLPSYPEPQTVVCQTPAPLLGPRSLWSLLWISTPPSTPWGKASDLSFLRVLLVYIQLASGSLCWEPLKDRAMAHKDMQSVTAWCTHHPRREYLPPCVFLLSFGDEADLEKNWIWQKVTNPALTSQKHAVYVVQWSEWETLLLSSHGLVCTILAKLPWFTGHSVNI